MAEHRLVAAARPMTAWLAPSRPRVLSHMKRGQDLLQLPEDLFPVWIDTLRSTKRLKNDDVTLLMIRNNGMASGDAYASR